MAGGQVTGFANAEFALVSNQNASEDNDAFSGDVFAINDATLALGPVSATSGPTAQSGQTGDNDATLTQSAISETGDTVAGSQVTGAVGSSDFSVSHQNTSEDSDSASGFAFALNDAVATLGPAALSVDTTGTSAEAQAGQSGDNTVVADQEVGAASGDSLAGAQVVGLVSSEEGTLEVVNQQSSDTDFAESGDADASNNIDVANGPQATALSADIASAALTPVEIFPGFFVVDVSATGGAAEAQVSQNGDNTADIAQAAAGDTGDAVSGGQVVGTVGGEEISISNQNTADDSDAEVGDAFVDNTAFVANGPTAVAAGAVVFFADDANVADVVLDPDFALATVTLFITGTVDGGSADAQASQSGDNAAVVSQAIDATTGDAVAGSQVTGVVGGGTEIDISNQNTAEDIDAIGGIVVADNVAVVSGGPAAIADSGFTFVSGFHDALAEATCTTDDCFASASAAIIIDVDATGGEADAQASQSGDNAADVAQALDAASGDALAGAQVVGAVAGDGSEITISNQNSAEDVEAFGGDVFAANAALVSGGAVANATSGLSVTFDLSDALATAVCVGDLCDAASTATITVAGSVTGGESDAQASQSGDNTAVVDQALAATTGDTVSGAQVVGAVAGDGSEITISNQNSAEDAEAFGGDVFAANVADVVLGAEAISTSGAAITIENNTANATSVCVGDFCTALALAIIGVTTDVTGGEADAQVSQSGDNAADVAQALGAATGDAVAGAQVTGAVAGDGSEITISGQNAAEETDAVSGSVFGDNVASVAAGAFAEATSGTTVDVVFNDAIATAVAVGDLSFAQSLAVVAIAPDVTGGVSDAQASQNGDNAVVVGQALEAATGDAVSGAQVNGAVAGAGSEITVSAQNTADDTDAISGSVFATNNADVVTGAEAFADSGVVVDVFATDAAATTVCVGDGCFAIAVAAIDFDAVVDGGEADAQVSQTGDNAVDVAQGLAAETGDAVAGAQVNGAVAGDGSEVDISAQNTADGADAFSGTVFANNVADLDAGPAAFAVTSLVATFDTAASAIAVAVGDFSLAIAATTFTGDVAVTGGDSAVQVSQSGDNDLALDQALVADTGDAVAGSQVFGVVAPDSEVTISGQNASEDSFSFSGDVFAANTAAVDGGPVADAATTTFVDADFASATAAVCVGFGCAATSLPIAPAVTVDETAGTTDAQASQTGDNSADIAQDIAATTGDALSGAQVVGIVGSEDAVVQIQNSDEDSASFSGLTDVANALAGFLGATAVSPFGDAAASHSGDSDAAFEQGFTTESGDAVTGGQITGSVA